MRHRIRAAALVIRPRIEPTEILLVKHCTRTDPEKLIWLPPGGGLEESDRSIFACAQRETREESGLGVELAKIAYIQEFVDRPNQIRHVAFYMTVSSFRGDTSLNDLPADTVEDLMVILGTAWINRADIANLNVYPTYLKTADFWTDAALDFPQTKYLDLMTTL